MSSFIAIPVSPDLCRLLESFLESVDQTKDSSAEQCIELTDRSTEELLDFSLTEPREFLALSSAQVKVVDFAISTANKASHMLSRQIYKKKTANELRPIADNIRATYWPAAQSDDGQARLAFPTDDTFAASFRHAVDICTEGNGSNHLDEIDAVLNQLTDEIIEKFFLKNAHAVKIGPVVRKSLDVSIDGTRKAIHAVIHRVVRNLDDDHLKQFMGHFEPVLQQH